MDHARNFSVVDQSTAVVAAGVYAGGKKVADIDIEEAGTWSRQNGHVVWIGLLEPDAEILARCSGSFICMTLPSRTLNIRISGRSWSNMARPSSSWRGRRN